MLKNSKEIEANKVDLIYFDPPFFTQRKHTLTNKDNSKTYEFDDKYNSIEEYLTLVENVLEQSKKSFKENRKRVFTLRQNCIAQYQSCDGQGFLGVRISKVKLFGHTKDGLIRKKDF